MNKKVEKLLKNKPSKEAIFEGVIITKNFWKKRFKMLHKMKLNNIHKSCREKDL